MRQGDAQLEQARVAALTHIEAGNRFLVSAKDDYESLAIDLIYEAIDEFRGAIVQAKDVDIETEAHA